MSIFIKFGRAELHHAPFVLRIISNPKVTMRDKTKLRQSPRAQFWLRDTINRHRDLFTVVAGFVILGGLVKLSIDPPPAQAYSLEQKLREDGTMAQADKSDEQPSTSPRVEKSASEDTTESQGDEKDESQLLTAGFHGGRNKI